MCQNDAVICVHHGLVENASAIGLRSALSMSKTSHTGAVPSTRGGLAAACLSSMEKKSVTVHRHASRCFALTQCNFNLW